MYPSHAAELSSHLLLHPLADTHMSVAPGQVREQSVIFSAADNVELAGKWFLPPEARGAPEAAIVVVCGMGVPARFYYGLARHLADHGAAVLSFDYRGVGASKRGSLKGMEAGIDVWAVSDLGAALALAHHAYPQLPLEAVAHSVGALLVGAAPDASRLSKLVFFAPHTGYWRDYAPRWRWLLFATWHLFMPGMTRLYGYFPGSKFGLGEDLPRRVALDWAGRRRPEIPTIDETRPVNELLSGYGNVNAATLAISVTDDAFAPPNAGQRLLALYPRLKVRHEVIAPATVGSRRLGHFGFLRRPTREIFWDRAAEWLLPDSSS